MALRLGRPHIVLAAIVGITMWSVAGLGLNFARLRSGWSNVSIMAGQAKPSSWDVVWSALDVAFVGMRETIQIAFLGTLLGGLLALPLALLASRNLFPGVIGFVARLFLASLRVMPSLLLAILFVIVVGLGPLAGVLAMAVYTVGFLGKLQYEALEGLDRAPLEAMHAIGASRLQTLRHVVLPEAANSLLSHILFVFEYNVRHGTVIGVVGAGGIGMYLRGYLRFFQYDRVLILLLVIFAVVVAIDMASRWIRERYLESSPRPSTQGHAGIVMPPARG